MAYPGSFEQAKRRAESLGRWLLVNVQSASEFQSHQLNRDTWKHDAVKNVVKENFVFWQTFDHSEEGRKVLLLFDPKCAIQPPPPTFRLT